MLHDRTGNRARKPFAVDCERAARGQPVEIGRSQDELTCPPHFFMQQTDGVFFATVGAERVRAHELRKSVRRMRLGPAHRPHFVEHDGNSGARRLPRRLTPRQPSADDVNARHGFFYVQHDAL
jgi:hypothetical protein